MCLWRWRPVRRCLCAKYVARAAHDGSEFRPRPRAQGAGRPGAGAGLGFCHDRSRLAFGPVSRQNLDERIRIFCVAGVAEAALGAAGAGGARNGAGKVAECARLGVLGFAVLPVVVAWRTGTLQ